MVESPEVFLVEFVVDSQVVHVLLRYNLKLNQLNHKLNHKLNHPLNETQPQTQPNSTKLNQTPLKIMTLIVEFGLFHWLLILNFI